ncbi:MAG: AtpZ/AtpI family protein [Rhizobiaceae bacterium]
MTGNQKDTGSGKSKAEVTRQTASSDKELAERLRKLDAKLDGKTENRKQAEKKNPDNAGFGMALRLSTEFVSAILVGAALGWGIDQLLGIAPWGMIILLLIGFCAGVLNVLRSAGSISDPHSGRRSRRTNGDG